MAMQMLATMDFSGSFRFRKLSRMGTSTTVVLVRKPAVEAVV